MGASRATDAELIEASRRGDTQCFGALVERYEAVAHRTAFVLGAGDETADVVQEAFVKAYLALHRFHVGKPFQPWLLTIVANETRNRRRWSSRHPTVPLSLIDDDTQQASPPNPQQVADDRETSRTLRDAIQTLPRPQREVIICRYLLDLSEQDTAQVLGVAQGTVKSRLSRGLRALEVILESSNAPDPANLGA